MEFWLSSRKVNFLWSQSELDVQTVFKCCGRYLPSAVLGEGAVGTGLPTVLCPGVQLNFTLARSAGLDALLCLWRTREVAPSGKV